jgi:hypothetical protein
MAAASTARRAPEAIFPRSKRHGDPRSVEAKTEIADHLVFFAATFFYRRGREVCEDACAATGAKRRAGRK